VAAYLLYDGECGLCRWLVVQILRSSRTSDLVPVAIESPLGARLLADLEPAERLRSIHLVTGGERLSAGAAMTALASKTRLLRPLGAVASHSPALADRLYQLVAQRRALLGRLIPRGARERADRRLADVRPQARRPGEPGSA